MAEFAFKKIVLEDNAEVKCKKCGSEFRISSLKQQNCPSCGCGGSWFPLEA